MNIFKMEELYINSSDDVKLPDFIMKRFQIIPTAFFKQLVSKIKLFYKLDEIIYWGGDVWVVLPDSKIKRSHFYKMIIVNLLCRLSGKRIGYMGCGVGEITGYSLFLARLCSRLANFTLVRDARSGDLLRLPKENVLVDLATVAGVGSLVSKKRIRNKSLVIGLSVLYNLPNPDVNFEPYVSKLTTLTDQLLAQGHRVTFLPMFSTCQLHEDDTWASEHILQRLTKKSGAIIQTSSSVNDFIKNIDSVDIVIGTRLHTNILAILRGVPSIGIAYRAKVSSFFEDIDLSDCTVQLENIEDIMNIIQTMDQDYSAYLRKFDMAKLKLLSKGKAYKDYKNENL